MSAYTVVMAEDDVALRTLISRWLKSLGHNVLYEAENGAQVVSAALKLKPDLIIMDIRMPVMDGVEAVERLEELGCDAAIVFLSGADDYEMVERACASGALAFVRKPFDKAQLAPAIQIAMKGRERLRQALQEIGRLNTTLDTRKKIERAKGILMKRHNLTEEAAFLKLQLQARSTHTKMYAVADAIIVADAVI